MAAKFEVYRDSSGEYRWRLKHNNGNVIAGSGEGYKSKDNCLKGIDSVKANAPTATVVECED